MGSEPVSEPVINDILEVARWTGSGVNRQPWEFLIIRDAEVKEKLGDWGAKPAATAGVVILIASTDDNAAFDGQRSPVTRGPRASVTETSGIAHASTRDAERLADDDSAPGNRCLIDAGECTRAVP